MNLTAPDPGADEAAQDDLSSFTVAPDATISEPEANPWHYWNSKLKALPEFEHLEQAALAFMFRHEEKVKAGRRVLGTCYLPSVQGDLKSMFDWLLESRLGYSPDFLIVLDVDWWENASVREREILLYHELCHAIQKTDKYGAPAFDKMGMPLWGIVGHDVEEFHAVVERYGVWNAELRAFINAAEAADKPKPEQNSNEPFF